MLRVIDQAVGGHVRVTSTVNRFAGDDSQSWALRIDGKLHGIDIAIESDGPNLIDLLSDALHALATLGLNLSEEIEAMKRELAGE